jgi:hypothetical protein
VCRYDSDCIVNAYCKEQKHCQCKEDFIIHSSNTTSLLCLEGMECSELIHSVDMTATIFMVLYVAANFRHSYDIPVTQIPILYEDPSGTIYILTLSMLQTRYLAQKNSYHLHYKKNSAVILMFLNLSVIFLQFTLITLKYKHKKAFFFKLTSALTRYKEHLL